MLATSRPIAISTRCRGSIRGRSRRLPPEGTAELHQFSEGAEVEIEILSGQAELRADVEHSLFELHESDAYGFDFLFRQRPLLHPPNRLTLHQLAQELDDGKHELRHGSLHIVWLRIPPHGRNALARRCGPLLSDWNCLRRGHAA